LAIALHLPVPNPFGDRPSSPRIDTSRRSPPDTSRNLERLTQIYHCLTFAAYSEAPGTFRVDRALEEPNLGNWGRIAYLPESWQSQNAEG